MPLKAMVLFQNYTSVTKTRTWPIFCNILSQTGSEAPSPLSKHASLPLMPLVRWNATMGHCHPEACYSLAPLLGRGKGKSQKEREKGSLHIIIFYLLKVTLSVLVHEYLLLIPQVPLWGINGKKWEIIMQTSYLTI